MRTECSVLSVLSSSQSAPLGVPWSLFETYGWGGTQARSGYPHPPPLRAAPPDGQKHNRDRMSRFVRSNVLEHFDDRMFETF